MSEENKLENIENIELNYLKFSDYKELKAAMIEAYSSMPDAYWKEHHIKSLINRFPEGQVVLKVNGEMAGCALSIVVNYSEFEGNHTYKQITGNYTFKTHTPEGDILYGIDVFYQT